MQHQQLYTIGIVVLNHLECEVAQIFRLCCALDFCIASVKHSFTHLLGKVLLASNQVIRWDVSVSICAETM